MFKKRIFGIVIFGLCCMMSCTLALQARAWQVRPSMNLAEIQDVFDRAGDNDKVMFHKGVYDFSAGPFTDLNTNEGAIVIQDKTLTVQGVGDVLIKGIDSILDSTGQAIQGLNAFHVINPDQTKDITFDNLKFETFMGAIITSLSITPTLSSPSMRNVTIRDCIFSDIQRNAIVLGNAGGNISIRNNRISAVRFAMFISWYWTAGHQGCQSDGTLVDISGNQIEAGRGGIALQNANKIRITGNDITGTGNFRWYGITIEAIKTGAQISNNRINNVKWGIDLCAAWVNDPLYAPFIEEFRNAKVLDNILTNISITGIWVEGGFVHDCQVSNNQIFLAPWGSEGIYSDGYSNRYTENVISGAGSNAVLLTTCDYTAAGGLYCAAHDEYFANNSVAAFSPGNAHYVLDFNTHDNHVHGICAENATVIDNGSNNEITCLTGL
jgi:hypothetical protein